MRLEIGAHVAEQTDELLQGLDRFLRTTGIERCETAIDPGHVATRIAAQPRAGGR